MEPKLILHIGTSKTGSSSLQAYFRDSERAKKFGAFYPSRTDLLGTDGGNHVGLTVATRAKEAYSMPMVQEAYRIHKESHYSGICITKYIFNQIEECKGKTCESGLSTLLLSNEHLSDRAEAVDLVPLQERLEDLFPRRMIVLYVRRQDDAYWSMYNEAVKNGETCDFDRFVQRNTHARLAFDYERILKAWDRPGWTLNVRRFAFDAQGGPGWSVINDFVTGVLDAEPVADGDIRTNMAFGSCQLRAKRFENQFRQYRPFHHPVLNRPMSKVINFFCRGRSLSKNSYREVLGEIYERHRHGNHWVEEAFLGGEPIWPRG